MLSISLLHKWRDEIEQTENEALFFIKEKEALEGLEKKLGKQEQELLITYSLAIENKLDYIYYNLNIKILNYGIKIGMDLQKAFEDYE